MIVIDMEVPKSCAECPIRKVEEFEWDDDYEEWEICPLIDDYINSEKDSQCPLIELDKRLEDEINISQYKCKKEMFKKTQKKIEKYVEYFLDKGEYEEAEKYQKIVNKGEKVLKIMEEKENEKYNAR